ncbi:MAG: UvrD-helicase domain-containing protein, partial [Elusimicrobiota bacterium]|nr:UvrD-helicase domain-containing protein [Elusimicrobiota bacterium]
MKEKLNLNKEQQEAVNYTDGPLLIFAGAGSGKTMVIVRRIVKLLKEGVKPFNIVAVTFTNKAAQEMRDRVKKIAGPAGASVWISTFHSLATKILRFDGKKNFTIYDEKDQLVVIKDCLEELDIDPKKFPPAGIREMISSAKNNLVDAESFKINASAASDSARYIVGDVYERYKKTLQVNGGYDFADLLIETIKLFKKYPEILDKYRQKFKYIMVDEYQDTNYAQYTLIKFLTPPQNNICVVGDDDQCLAEGTPVETPSGQIPVENFSRGDSMVSAAGHGKTSRGAAEKISKRKHKGRIASITTRNGRHIRLTLNHILFGKLKPARGLYYLYLMYKKDMGYRIGVTRGVRSKRKSNQTVNGLVVRLNQERADKVWVLKTFKNREEALYYEQYYAFKYGIPTYVFYSEGRGTALGNKRIKELYSSLDTRSAAENLMESLDIDPRFPHITAAGYVNNHINRRIINFTMFGDNRRGIKRPWHAHRIQLNSSDKKLKKALARKDFNIHPGQKNTWRVETSRKDYSRAEEFIEKLASAGGSDTVKKARLTPEKAYHYMPASHILPGMAVAVYEKGQIKEDIVKEVKYEDYDGYVYDMSVPDFRNYIAGGIVVHNSIYSWRGANIRNILEFEKHFKDAKIIKLEQNYRSTGNILSAAHNVIKNNPSRKAKKLWT